ncbi:MAG: hypothetical protein NPIRA02_00700 [Nitrospirales bacterium]|nr:MAG: hypothetical protein NPIRA02_00700 [Nitrospirales bacterium]
MRSKSRKTKCPAQHLLVVVVLVSLTGCLSYSSEYGCKGYPDGVNCQSVSSVYDMEHESGTNGTQSQNSGSSRTSGQPHLSSEGPILGRPVVTPPEVLRVWITPWRDDDNRLHEGSYVYVLVKEADFAYGVSVASGGRKRNKRVITPLRGMSNEPGQLRDELPTSSSSPLPDNTPQSPSVPNGTSSLLPELQKKAREQGGLSNMDKAVIFDHVLKQQGR